MHAMRATSGALAAFAVFELLAAGGPTPVHAQNPTIPGAIQYPGRAAIFGFPNGGTIPQIRFWLNHGPAALAELTGPNDKQLVGDFRDLGHDQVLFMNYWGGSRRTVIGDFSPSGRFPGQPEPPRPPPGARSAPRCPYSATRKTLGCTRFSTAGTTPTILPLLGLHEPGLRPGPADQS